MTRFNNMDLQSCVGKIYELCKDQHGCRFLQKQLDSRDPQIVHTVWLETNQHVVELMIDPFGNYLCQKLLEYCNDEERTELIKNAAKEMVRIALNQHGTRALQKMIEYVSTPEQVEIIVNALRDQVCALIEDLNGNHVIQKCLNKLSSPEATFIFEAVGNNCLEVGTHRHGCCVMQRCIDHATGEQKDWLIKKITESSVPLVQDPFGNYVMQYIIDLDEPKYTEPIVHTMFGQIVELSKLKFSSNVIEKCLRCATNTSKDLIVDELVKPGDMERLLRDNFGNYVVQTAVDYATPSRKQALVEAIRPLLPSIRSTPCGRRLQVRITQWENATRSTASLNGAQSEVNQQIRAAQVTPTDDSQGQITSRPPHGRLMGTTHSIMGAASPKVNGVNNSSPNGSSTAQSSINGNANGTYAETNGIATNGTLTAAPSVNGYSNGSVASPPQGQRTQQQAAPRQYTPQHQQLQTPTSNGTDGTEHWL